MWDNFRKLRKVIDDFAPDFIVIFADDQYENFREDIIPPFCVYGLDRDFDQQVWNHGMNAKIANYWGEPHDGISGSMAIATAPSISPPGC